jgi:hypothetical protein
MTAAALDFISQVSRKPFRGIAVILNDKGHAANQHGLYLRRNMDKA